MPTTDPFAAPSPRAAAVPPNPSSMHAERMRRFIRAGLYLVTSQALSAGRETRHIVREALAAGVTLIQLREKEMAAREFMALAVEVRRMTADAGALLIVNDRLDIALAVGADGVHLGREDLPLDAARRIAPDLILGASSHSEAEALEAQGAGASYVNIGPLFPTGTKAWGGAFLGIEGLRAIGPCLSVPFTVMGGIKLGHIPALTAAGARTLAVVTAVTAAPDPRAATAEWLAAIRRETANRG
jgi:thiamine-phosphate pyrophosphorylase